MSALSMKPPYFISSATAINAVNTHNMNAKKLMTPSLRDMRYHQEFINLALYLKAFPLLHSHLSLCHCHGDGDTDTDASV